MTQAPHLENGIAAEPAMTGRDDIPAEKLSTKLMAGLRPEPPIDTTLFIPAERQREMAFRATLPYRGREEVEGIIREAITETARVIKRHLASRPSADHEAVRQRAVEDELREELNWHIQLLDKIEDQLNEFGTEALPIVGETIGEWRHARAALRKPANEKGGEA